MFNSDLSIKSLKRDALMWQSELFISSYNILWIYFFNGIRSERKINFRSSRSFMLLLILRQKVSRTDQLKLWRHFNQIDQIWCFCFVSCSCYLSDLLLLLCPLFVFLLPTPMLLYIFIVPVIFPFPVALVYSFHLSWPSLGLPFPRASFFFALGCFPLSPPPCGSVFFYCCFVFLLVVIPSLSPCNSHLPTWHPLPSPLSSPPPIFLTL